MDKKYYITTPIYYASGKLHVGHCNSTVFADACARFKRMQGFDVMFLTGSDEHGMKIATCAEKAGLTPQVFVDNVVQDFKNIWKLLDISYDKFIRTTDKEHVECVEKIMQKLFDNGEIYLGKYEGHYCVPCETYFTESQLVDGNCPDCGRPVQFSSEDCYFLRLSKYQKFIEELFAREDFLVPESRKNEIFNNFVKPGVQDLCLTRTSFDWGVKAPFNPKHVIYVWCDALINYISALGYGTNSDEDFKKFWPANVHVIGRDISRFHAVIWPILLKMIGVEPPKQIHSTGFVTLKGDKISKSKSNGFSPEVLCDRYGSDALRYYLLKEGPIYQDIPYYNDVFLKTINSDLCNDLGNLVSRTLAMLAQSFDGVIPAPNKFEDIDVAMINNCNNLYNKVSEYMDNQRTDLSIKEIFAVIRNANKYIDETTPWILAKSEEGKERLKTVLYTLSETIRICVVLLQPYLTKIPAKVFDQFNTPETLKTFESIKEFNVKNYGIQTTKKEAIFARINIDQELKVLDNPKNEQEKQVKKENVKEDKKMDNNEVSQITIDDFFKVKLVVGKILKSENVEGSVKLLKNTVLINGVEKTIVSGIAQYYKPEDIIGKQVVVVENLKPIKLKGILSEGMILCASNDKTNELCLVSPLDVMPDGSVVC